MKKRMSRLAIAALAASPLLAAAQQPTPPANTQNQPGTSCSMAMHAMMMGDMGGGPMRPDQRAPGAMMRGDMRGRMNDSSMMTQMASELGLSDAQLGQFRAIHQRACTAAQPHMTMAMQARQAAMKALEGDKPNLDHFEDQLDKAAKHMVQAQVEMAKGMIEIRTTLTPVQRQKLDQMHQQMMQGGMRPGDMPRGMPRRP
jgi:Spy/CpxP family protein refolding chaperone